MSGHKIAFLAHTWTNIRELAKGRSSQSKSAGTWYQLFNFSHKSHFTHAHSGMHSLVRGWPYTCQLPSYVARQCNQHKYKSPNYFNVCPNQEQTAHTGRSSASCCLNGKAAKYVRVKKCTAKFEANIKSQFWLLAKRLTGRMRYSVTRALCGAIYSSSP